MPKLDNNTLLHTVDTILLEALNGKNRLQLINRHKDFSIDYPGLFNMIAEDPKNFDRNRLLSMLNMKDNIDTNKITHEAASSQIGQQYYNEYVKPLVDDLDKKKLTQ